MIGRFFWRAGGLAILGVLPFLVLGACATRPPSKPNDVCSIFRERPGWYNAALDAQKQWNIHAATLMAVAHRESSYVSDARPPRTRVLWVVPWRRPSSAYGFAQATDEAWSDYLNDTRNRFADRDDFADAVDFVGWSLDRAARTLGIDRSNAKHLYLAYHEGLTGYRRGGWREKEWLLCAASRMSSQAQRYHGQLERCRSGLKRKRWWWPV